MLIVYASWCNGKDHQKEANTLAQARQMALELLNDPYRDYIDELYSLSICDTRGRILEKCYSRNYPEQEQEWRKMVE